MKIAPLKMTDPWYHRALRDGRTSAESLRDVPVETVVQMEQVEILHHGPDLNFRPYLHLSGAVGDIEPEVVLPYGIASLAFRQGSEPILDAFYEFDNAQLAELVRKDYFSASFHVPAEMIGIPWPLPGTADFLIVAPEYADEVPLVFMGLHNQSDLALNQINSGYDLAEYFPDFTMVEISTRQRQTQEVRTRSDEMQDMFSAEELGTRRDSQQRSDGTVPGGIFDRLVAEAQEEQSREQEQAAARAVYDPRTAEGMYHTRIRPGVDEALTDDAPNTDDPIQP